MYSLDLYVRSPQQLENYRSVRCAHLRSEEIKKVDLVIGG